MRIPVVLALAVLSPLAAAAAQSGGVGTSAPRARTTDGLVQGVTAPSGVRMFRGIPFAAPPVRELRWRPPQPAVRWTGVRPADRFANQCMQARVFGDMMFRNAGVSEDCLYLNVWAPAAAARPNAGLPVLVYFYGGGFVAGDGSEPRYDGESMARQGIVVVTLSYRLGIFGFFSHPELSAESPAHASGNYALMDQTAALRWVRDNIAAFGGDPHRVTIGGESAGSFSVSAQMASPLAQGLFARAIGESGAFFSRTISTPARTETEQRGAEFARSVGAPSLAALRALSATELLEASGRPGAARFGPNVDGYFFSQVPAEIFAAGRQAHVPLLAGWNSEEMSARALLPDGATPATTEALLTRVFKDRAADAAKVFPAGTTEEAVQSATDLASDQFIGYSTWKWLDVQARTGGQPVYRYFYAHPRPPLVPAMGDARPGLAGGIERGTGAAPQPPARGAVHSAEIEYALGNLPLNHVFAWTPDDHTVSATMQRYFANFITTGDPNGGGLPHWPVGAVSPDGQAMRMRIDVESRAEPEPRARYLFLDQVFARATP
ncbi:MAG TPA: carboxylesterase family protein [Gemmatirosa sp.]